MPLPTKVLFYDHTAALGGGEMALLHLVKALDRHLVAPQVLLSAEGPLADRLRKVCDVHVLPLPEKIRKAKKDTLGFGSLLRLKDIGRVTDYICRIAGLIRTQHIQLVHTNSLKADIIGGCAARLARCPVIWHVRDRIEPDYLPTLVVKTFRALSRILPTHVLANSEATLATLRLPRRKQGEAIPSGISLKAAAGVVHDGISVASFNQTTMEGRLPVIGLVGRISPWKGQHVFIEAAKIVTQRYPHARVRIIGAPLFGEEQYEKSLMEQRKRLGLENVVEFTGFKSDVTSEIEQLTLLVHASTTGEPFGQVIIEGMAARKPVIATNGGGVPEIVVHGETGLVVPMGNARAMAEAICEILPHPVRGGQMGDNGYERVRNHFTIEKTARAVERVYRHVLALEFRNQCL